MPQEGQNKEGTGRYSTRAGGRNYRKHRAGSPTKPTRLQENSEGGDDVAAAAAWLSHLFWERKCREDEKPNALLSGFRDFRRLRTCMAVC